MVYAGIDYSINCPCICVYDDADGEYTHKNCEYYFYQHHLSFKEQERRKECFPSNIHSVSQYEWNTDDIRYFAISDFFLSVMLCHDVKIVAMEDYALNGIGKVFNIAECTSSLKYMMMMTNIEYHVFSPTYVKLTFSGKGNADKKMMHTAYEMRYNISISELYGKRDFTDSPVSDIVDSHAMLYTYFKGDYKNGTR